ncbi:MAG TPA: S9 family peptidase [Thermoanaerobaculia bacterium]|nr:S9 family peptidase [Thermoanaerobaculia bacterium]
MKSTTPLALSLLALLPSVPCHAADDDLERTVSLMAKICTATSPSFSPDGKTIAYTSNIGGAAQVWTVDAAGGYPQLVTAFDDAVGGVQWSPDGKWLAFTLAPGGGMNVQVYLVRPDGTGVKRLTDGGKETNGLGPWSHDGTLLVTTSNRRSGAAIDPYLYGVADGTSRMVLENTGVGDLSDLTRDNRRGLMNRLVNRGDNNLYVVDLASGKEMLITPHAGPGSFDGLFSPDGRTVYLSTNAGRDLAAFARLELTASGGPGKTTMLAERPDAELQSFNINDAGTVAALVWNAAGRSELELLDLESGKSVAKPKLPGEIAFGLDFSRDGKQLALAVAGAAQPADVWVMDVASGNFRQVTRSPHAGVDLAQLVRPELVKFKAHDGLELSGWLYKPASAATPFPLVLSFHGGPEGQERPGFNSQYQALVSRGIAVFAPNVRGSSGFGKRFVNLDNGALRVEGIKDIKDCVDAAVKAGADPKRIGIMGGSYGGYMTVSGLTEYPELFAAGADLFGVVNFETFFAHTEPWMAAISKVEYGDPDKEVDMLRRLSPIHKVDRITAPTIVLHGANDTNVPVVEAEQVVDSLKKRGVPVEYVLFPDEGHGWRKTPNRIKSTIAVTKWFEKYLKGDGPATKSGS